MVPLNRIRGRLRPAILIAALMAGVAVPALAESSLFAPQAPAATGERLLVAQNRQNNSAELLVRIQDLEQTIRELTGRVEGLEFQVQQLLKVNQDNEFRFQQLEGGAPVGKPQAAVPTDGATPSDALPQEQTPALSPETDPLTDTPDIAVDAPDLPMHDMPMDDHALGDSADPLLRGGLDQLGTLPEDDAVLNQPLDLSFDGQTQATDGDARAQYDAAYDAMTRGDYAFASDQFAQFLRYYATDPAAPDAVNYLGEALIQQREYQEASEVLAQGYVDYAQSKRAPDIMLRLGVALTGLGQGDLACQNFAKLRERYPNVTPAFADRVAQEAQNANCPVTN